MLGLALLVVVHVVMVFAVDPYALRAMTTGGYDEDRYSPEARNARPFVHLAPAKVDRAASLAAAPHEETP
jgi:hypothetical protein